MMEILGLTAITVSASRVSLHLGAGRALPNARVAANLSMAAQLALNAGMDQAFLDAAFDFSTLGPAVAAGYISESVIDRAAGNILGAKFAAGLFDGQLPDPADRAKIYTAENRALAQLAAAEGAVLLHNVDNFLPLQMDQVRTLAVIGPNAGCFAPAAQSGAPTCNTQPGIDCNGNDLVKINGSTLAACCALCTANVDCVVAVMATDADNQCLLKSACPAQSALPGRVLIDVGRLPPAQASPWNCDAMRGMLGGYSNLERSTDAYLDNAAHVVTLLEAAQAASNASGGKFQVTAAQGVAQSGFDTSGIPAAVALAAAADVVIVCLGDGGESVGYDSSVSCGEGADRPSLDLPGAQLQLLAALLATNKPVVVVLMHGRPVTFGTDYGGSAVSRFLQTASAGLDKEASAVLAAWRPGCEGGTALWELLTGVVSPSGRLAQHWPVSVGGVRIGGVGDHMQKWSNQGGGGFTLNTPFSPNYAFGFGLDYLAVSYGLSSVTVNAALQTVSVAIVLLNAAARGGSYVVEVFFSQAVARFTRYQRMLAGFSKVNVGPKSSTAVAFDVPYSDLAYYDPVSEFMVLEAGTYTFYFCACITPSSCPPANTHTVTVPQTVGGL